MTTPPWAAPLAEGHLVIALVRHGRTAYNASRRFLGRTDLPLDDVGRQQVRALAPHVRFDGLYTSPLARARQTAEALRRDDAPAPVTVDALRELDPGDLEGLSIREALARHPSFFAAWQEDPAGVCCPGGEGLAEVQERAWAALEDLASRHPPGQVVGVVSHQLVIASLTCRAQGAPLSDWRRAALDNAAITVLARHGDRWGVEAVGWRPEGA